MRKSRTYIATPPGATIKEQLADRGMTQKEFALRMDLSEKHVSKLLNGDVRLTPDMAFRLEMVLGVPARFWNNLEAIYREKLTRVERENAMDADLELAAKYPHKELVKLGWLPDAVKKTDRVFNLRKFFEVTRLGMVMEGRISGLACRRLTATEKGDFALAAWAQQARLEARKRNTQEVDLQGLRNDLLKIRAMTVMPPSAFCPKLESMLAARGIALVLLPHLSGSCLHGATFPDGTKIVVGLTLRGKDADKFWFSLFHELGHILLGHIWRTEGAADEDEDAANAFARDTLLSPKDYQEFVNAGDFSKQAIIQFAKLVDLLPGIVVGRLQKEGMLRYDCLNDLKTRYVFSN